MNLVWHRLDASQTLESLQATAQGLSSKEAQSRLSRFGPNVWAGAKKRGPLLMFLRQFSDFMIVVLLAACVVSALVGDRYDAWAIAAILVLNAIIGFIQEFRAERAMEALKAMAAPAALVLRDGKPLTLAASKVVPGDIVLLEAGRIVPADLRLLEASHLKVDESSLTGESFSVEKSAEPLVDEFLPLGDRKNMAYAGTRVTAGRGSGVVAATGGKTEFGKIAESLGQAPETKTPLQKRLLRFGQNLSLGILVVCAGIFLMGVWRGESMLLMFMTAVSLAVAAIPEALPAVVTISLALGAHRMVLKKALVRKLPAVETLGSVTFICTDKTGTLTVHRMRVERTVGAWDELAKAMVLCNDARQNAEGRFEGDPTETALLEAAAGRGIDVGKMRNDYPRVAERPFDSVRKCMTTFHRAPGGGMVSFTKGAVEALLERSASPGAVAEMSEKMAAEGLRTLAFAVRRWEALPRMDDEAERNLIFLGLAGLLDPLREEARASIDECRKAGIVPVMITGDHPNTAETIARRLGLGDGQDVMTGKELAEISDEAFARRVKDIRVYARVSPDQKLKIVKALQVRGEFVAMTGDGVNDAPALKAADIGVAMGIQGTDVAKEASSMVLLDDNFATLVRAVEEGRKIYDNLRRFIRYAVTTNCAEVMIIFLAPLLGLPIPFLPIQILWINLLTDGLPGLALASEPAEKNVMQRLPRPPNEGVFAQGLGSHVVWIGCLMTALVLGTQAAWRGSGHGQSMIFAVLCFSQLAHLAAIRSETQSLFTQGIFSNKPLLAAFLFTAAAHLATLYVPPLNRVFHTTPLSGAELAAAIALSSTVFFAVEFEKWVFRKRRKA